MELAGRDGPVWFAVRQETGDRTVCVWLNGTGRERWTGVVCCETGDRSVCVWLNGTGIVRTEGKGTLVFCRRIFGF